MGWIRDIRQCPRCGYKSALWEYRPGGGLKMIFCLRCGYSGEYFFNDEKYESLKSDAEHKDDNHEEIWSPVDEELRRRCWEWDVFYPSGSYICRRKGEDGFEMDSIRAGTIEKLLEHLGEYDVCKHTYYKARSWFIKDLRSNTTTLYSVDEYYKCKDDDRKRRDEDDECKTDLTWFNL